MKDTPRILIVDDEPEFVQALQAALEEKTYTVVVASERGQAERLVRSDEPDLIVLGTIVPRGEAFLFHKWLKQTLGFSNLPIMVVNTSPEKQLTKGWQREEGMHCDAEDYLERPVDPQAIVLRVAKVLDKVTKKIRVLIVDDHAVVRDGIRAVLGPQRDMQTVGEAINGQEALVKTVELLPDVVLMDIVMPVMNGLEATKEIVRQCPRTRVLMLSQYDDQENILASKQAGALGFISKTVASSQLLDGIRTVSQGSRFGPSTKQN